MVCFFTRYLPLTVYYTINSSTTIFTFLLNYLLYNVSISTNQKRSVFVALLGIVLVINGRAIYSLLDSSYEFHTSYDYGSSSLTVLCLVGVGVVLWSLVWAYSIVTTSKHNASFNEFILINSLFGHFMFASIQMHLVPEG
jgi:drug/metabolite transporter (DMT)-like permease